MTEPQGTAQGITSQRQEIPVEKHLMAQAARRWEAVGATGPLCCRRPPLLLLVRTVLTPLPAAPLLRLRVVAVTPVVLLRPCGPLVVRRRHAQHAALLLPQQPLRCHSNSDVSRLRSKCG